MTDKEFRRLRRKDLIEIIYQLQKDNLQLQSENSDLKKQIEERNLKVSKIGSIADAALQLNGVFEAAQSAANQYVIEIKRIRDRQLMESGLSDGKV